MNSVKSIPGSWIVYYRIRSGVVFSQLLSEKVYDYEGTLITVFQ